MQTGQEGLKQNLKAVRNRIYAQRSRQRHRNYVSCLEQERQLLLDRLERLERENREMRLLLERQTKGESSVKEEKEGTETKVQEASSLSSLLQPSSLTPLIQSRQLNSFSPVFSPDFNHFVAGELDAPTTTFMRFASPLVTPSPSFLGRSHESTVNESMRNWRTGIRWRGCQIVKKRAFRDYQMTWRISFSFP